MAERRMFAMTIIDSDAFLDMPLGAQALYFHICMRADDDGFLNNPKKVQRIVGASDNDLEHLISKRFLIAFPSGVVVVKHWLMHNRIKKDRYKPTVYTSEKLLLSIKENGSYTEVERVGEQLENNWNTNGEQTDTKNSSLEPQYSISIRLGKDSVSKEENIKLAQRDESPCAEVSAIITLPRLNSDEFPITQEQVDTFSEAYPAVDVMAELKKMKAWLLANKKNQKKDVLRFANNWLSKAQDQSARFTPKQFSSHHSNDRFDTDTSSPF